MQVPLTLLCLFALAAASPPNFLFILADDLGFGEVSITPGRTNTNITTPNIAALASSGATFLRAYSGAPVCAPSRGALMTGKHTGHATIRGNKGFQGGDWPLAANPSDRTFLSVLQAAGYHVSCIGKWGMGGTASSGSPTLKGCSDYYGVLDQSLAHNMYPSAASYTLRYPASNGSAAWEELPFPANANASRAVCMAPGSACVWTHDLWTAAAAHALTAHAGKAAPLFVYLAYTDPHAGGWSGTEEAGNPVPSDGAFAQHTGKWPTVEIDHASAITNYLDKDVGALVGLLDKLGMSGNTITMATSDNGSSNEGGHDYAFFDSSGPLRGFKRCLTEGGIRVPLVVAGPPSLVTAGTVSHFPVSFYDIGDTVLELAGVPPSQWLRQDGASFASVLLGGGPPPPPRPLYWEFCTSVHPPLEPRSGPGWGHAIVNGTWKAVSFFEDQSLRLYDLSSDVYEVHDLAADFPEVLQGMQAWAAAQHTDSPDFPVANCSPS